MKKILVLGTGCPKCEALYKDVVNVAQESGLDCQVEKVTKLQDIMQYGVFVTPALVVDGEVKVAGKAPSVVELRKMLS